MAWLDDWLGLARPLGQDEAPLPDYESQVRAAIDRLQRTLGFLRYPPLLGAAPPLAGQQWRHLQADNDYAALLAEQERRWAGLGDAGWDLPLGALRGPLLLGQPWGYDPTPWAVGGQPGLLFPGPNAARRFPGPDPADWLPGPWGD